MVSQWLHGESFNSIVLKAAAPNLATLLSQNCEIQDYELEESDTKHVFPEETKVFQT